jgi:hypothetical protein
MAFSRRFDYVPWSTFNSDYTSNILGLCPSTSSPYGLLLKNVSTIRGVSVNVLVYVESGAIYEVHNNLMNKD